MRLAGTPRDLRRIEGHRFLLSWHCPHSPLRCSTICASTPEGAEAPPSDRRYHPTNSRSAHVVSHHLDGFLRAAAASLLHLAASHEVRRVSRESTTQHTRRHPGRWPRFPRRGSHPSKGSPRQQPYRITAAFSLLPFSVDLLARSVAEARLELSDDRSRHSGAAPPKRRCFPAVAPAEAGAPASADDRSDLQVRRLVTPTRPRSLAEARLAGCWPPVRAPKRVSREPVEPA